MTTARSRKTSRNKIMGLAAAGVLMLGAGSTFAAWTETGDRSAGSETVTTGEWEWDVTTASAWFDVSPELDADEDGTVDEAERVAIDLSTFAIVPGTIIQAEISVDADIIATIGEWLDAQVASVEVSTGPTADAAFVNVTADVNSTGDGLVVTLEFPFTNTDYENQSAQQIVLDLGEITVTVVQVRPALDGSSA